VRNERTFVGLDVHAWSVTGHALDGDTGQIWQRKLSPDPAEILGWVKSLPGPVRVGYEAGPTGYGLYRHLNGHGVSCVVGAPSKQHRPHGDRVKTDTRDAELLARLLKLDEFAEITVPSVEQEAARDLVRAREDVRGDLMYAEPSPHTAPSSTKPHRQTPDDRPLRSPLVVRLPSPVCLCNSLATGRGDLRGGTTDRRRHGCTNGRSWHWERWPAWQSH
jgi:hypothetical protein